MKSNKPIPIVLRKHSTDQPLTGTIGVDLASLADELKACLLDTRLVYTALLARDRSRGPGVPDYYSERIIRLDRLMLAIEQKLKEKL